MAPEPEAGHRVDEAPDRRPSAAVYQRRRIAVALALLGALALAVAALVALTALGDDDAGDRAGSEAAGAADASGSATTTTSTSEPAAPTTTIRSTGRFTVAAGSTPVVGTGEVHRYRVEVEEGTGVDPDEFARAVDETLTDPRGWTTADGVAVQRVSDDDADLVVRLATPATTDQLCYPLDTAGEVSCAMEAMAVINLTRWREGSLPSRLALDDYRDYVVTHEFGHLLGHGHVGCPGPGLPAPVMMQQSYSIGDCAPNPWPVAGE